MTYLQSLILGIVQGLTEFLPVSSSAHLVLTPFLFGWEIPAEQVFPFGVLVQLGTLLAVILYFWKDLWAIIREFIDGILKGRPFEQPNARLGWYLVLATIPAGLAGLLLKDTVEGAFQSPVATAAFLFVTAALLVFAEWYGRRQRDLGCMNWKDALVIGAFQILSLFPGISRSGSTIAGGMTRQLERPAAGRFSFLMSIPVMLAAGGLEVFDLADVPNLASFLPVLLVGFLAAAVVGFLSIHWLLRFLTRRPLTIFAIYCVVFGGLNLVLAYV
ncbi:MAG TPA: undecaprenyl-diphosphatase UppP [Anaerolineaceae bacterium]|nr:undecaprenyl-diphosphatase UppP [Anaerolineaceae bacterium]